MRTPAIAFGPFVFDPDSRMLKKDGTELPLPPRVTGVLEVLLRRAGDVVPRQELMETVWKDAFVTDTSLAEAVSVLRQTLGDDPQSPSYIQTLHRRGYRWVARVERPSDAGKGTLTPPGPPPADTAIGPVSPSIGGQLVPWSLAIICAILAGLAIRQALSTRQNDEPVTRFGITTPTTTRFDQRSGALAIAPDSSRVVWSACDDDGCRLYRRDADRLSTAPIPGTGGAAAPFFSPDGRWVGFFADGRLKKIAVAGGAAVILADASDPLGAVWTPTDEIFFAGGASGLKVINGSGGDARILTVPIQERGEVRHVWPAYQRAANLLLFTITGAPGPARAGRLAALRLDAPQSAWTTLLTGVGNASAAAHDVLVISKGTELQAVTFDPRRGEVNGAPQVVLNSVATSAGAAQFATSQSGALLAVTARPAETPSFAWFSRDKAAPTNDAISRLADLHSASLAPDGRRIAGVDGTNSPRPEIWIADLERGTSSRLTHERFNASPVWSPDGTKLFFASSDGGAFAIYERDSESKQQARRLHDGARHAWPSSVSPDGTRLAYVSADGATGMDVWVLPLNGDPPQPLIRTQFDEAAPAFSPQGELLAYQSNEAGRWEVFVRQANERRVAVSTDGGTHPFWAADGKELFFQAGDRLMRASVSPDGTNVGSPVLIGRFVDSWPVGVDRAGRVLLKQNRREAADEAILTLQWIREARQLLGPPSAAMPR
jgi:serine/threonine-protein kinase